MGRKFPCRNCEGFYALSFARRVACPATRLVEVEVRKVEGCLTKGAVPLTLRKDPRKSSRSPKDPRSKMSVLMRKRCEKQTLTRHTIVSKRYAATPPKNFS